MFDLESNKLKLDILKSKLQPKDERRKRPERSKVMGKYLIDEPSDVLDRASRSKKRQQQKESRDEQTFTRRGLTSKEILAPPDSLPRIDEVEVQNVAKTSESASPQTEEEFLVKFDAQTIRGRDAADMISAFINLFDLSNDKENFRDQFKEILEQKLHEMHDELQKTLQNPTAIELSSNLINILDFMLAFKNIPRYFDEFEKLLIALSATARKRKMKIWSTSLLQKYLNARYNEQSFPKVPYTISGIPSDAQRVDVEDFEYFLSHATGRRYLRVSIQHLPRYFKIQCNSSIGECFYKSVLQAIFQFSDDDEFLNLDTELREALAEYTRELPQLLMQHKNESDKTLEDYAAEYLYILNDLKVTTDSRGNKLRGPAGTKYASLDDYRSRVVKRHTYAEIAEISVIAHLFSINIIVFFLNANKLEVRVNYYNEHYQKTVYIWFTSMDSGSGHFERMIEIDRNEFEAAKDPENYENIENSVDDYFLNVEENEEP